MELVAVDLIGIPLAGSGGAEEIKLSSTMLREWETLRRPP